MKRTINIRDYTYDLPPEKIALFPLKERDQSKLLIYDRGDIQHERFANLASHLPSNATLFFNNTKVIQARLHFKKDTGAVIEVFLLSPLQPSSLLLQAMQSISTCQWKCTIGNLKRWKNETLAMTSDGFTLQAILVDRDEGVVEFRWNGGATFADIIDRFGATALPPYLKRDPVPEDKTRYQTIYSNEEGAVAAPTAGLHFTEQVFKSLDDKGISREFVTLHVSAGTFQPVKVENAAEHIMHREQVMITRENILHLLREERIPIPVGTTSMRSIESLYWYGVKLSVDATLEFNISQHDPYTLNSDLTLKNSLDLILKKMDREQADMLTGETSIYIMPGYRFRVCKGLITNFHQPNSTLILLVAAFIGEDWRLVYKHALDNGYRFLSYGDSSLLFPKN
jgi:S-adenosylmethionine:tRNA ribosyltransferase-isomerase